MRAFTDPCRRPDAGCPPRLPPTGCAPSTFRVALRSLSQMPASVIAASVAINAASLFLPLVAMQVYDRIVPQRATETLAVLLAALAGVVVMDIALRVSRAAVAFWSATGLAWQQHDEALRRITQAPLSWWGDESAARVVDRLRAFTAVAEWRGTPSCLALIDLPFALVFLGVMAVVGGWVVLVPLAVFAAMGAFLWRQAGAVKRVSEARATLETRHQDFLLEALTGLATIKGSAMEEQMARRQERLAGKLAAATHHAALGAEEARAHADLLAGLTQIATMGIGAVALIHDHLSIGALACCTLLASRAAQPLLRCIGMWGELQNLVVEESKATAIRALPEPEERPTRAATTGPLSVTLREVSTAPTSALPTPLEAASLTLAPGSIIAVVGGQGPGTSPLAGLLTGKIAPLGGHIRLGELDVIRDADLLRGRVIAVSPAHRAINGTLIDNITMFRGGPAIEPARAAARLIGLEDDIHALPAGYATRLGSGLAAELSDGLLQRVAIARAIALEPGLLILDEANAPLDARAERQLADALPHLRRLMTVLILTNRPSFAAHADRILRLDGGRFVDGGATGHDPSLRQPRAS